MNTDTQPRFQRMTERQRQWWQLRSCDAAGTRGWRTLHGLAWFPDRPVDTVEAARKAIECVAALDGFTGVLSVLPGARAPVFDLSAGRLPCERLPDGTWHADAMAELDNLARSSGGQAAAWVRYCADGANGVWLLAVDPVYCDTTGLLAWASDWHRALDGVANAPSREERTFADVIAWQERLVEAPQARIGLDYWLAQWRPDDARDPGLWPRSANAHGLARAEVELGQGDSVNKALAMLRDELGVSNAVIMATVWACALRKCIIARRVAVGVMLSGRPMDAFARVAGCLRRPAPLALEIADDASPREALATVSRLMASHQRFQAVFDWSRLDRDSPYAEDMPFLIEEDPPTSHAMRLYPADEACVASLHWRADDAGRITARIRFAADRLRRNEAEAMAGYLGQLVQALPRRLDGRLVQWLAHRHERWPDVPAHRDTFTDAETAFRLHPAMAFENAAGRRQTHGEIDALVRRRAAWLASYGGTERERPVAIVAGMGTQVVVTVLAALRIGRPFALLDPRWPAYRIDEILARLDPACVLSDEPVREGWTGLDAPLAAAMDESVGLASSLHDAAAAYFACTSGTTGTPRIVVATRHALAAQLQWLGGVLSANAADRVLQRTPPAFDAALWEMLLPATAGMTSVFADPADLAPDRLAITSSNRGISMLQATPSLLHALVARGGLETCRALRLIVAGGERLSAGLLGVLQATTSARVMNAYGPTECTVQVTMHPPVDVSGDPSAPVSIGQPMENATLGIRDGVFDVVSRGAVGELCIGGSPLARAYLGDAGTTALRFVPDPAIPGGRLYRTGDLARELHDGTIVVIGRTDRQVKVNGVRIEPAEVEAILRQVRGVPDAYVHAVHGEGGGHLVAYLLGIDDADAEQRAREQVFSRLPTPWHPARYVLVPQPPVTHNGKLDIARLLVLASVDEPVRHGPRNATEEAIATIWGQILGRDRISVHDSFFALGGHSLLFATAITRVREHFGVELPLRAIFDHPTVADLGRKVDEQIARKEADHAPGIQ